MPRPDGYGPASRQDSRRNYDTCSICGTLYHTKHEECPECGATWIDQAAVAGDEEQGRELKARNPWDD